MPLEEPEILALRIERKQKYRGWTFPSDVLQRIIRQSLLLSVNHEARNEAEKSMTWVSCGWNGSVRKKAFYNPNTDIVWLLDFDGSYQEALSEQMSSVYAEVFKRLQSTRNIGVVKRRKCPTLLGSLVSIILRSWYWSWGRRLFATTRRRNSSSHDIYLPLTNISQDTARHGKL